MDCCEGYGGNCGDLSWQHKGKVGWQTTAEQWMYGTVTEWCEWRLFITVLGDMGRDGRKQLVNVALEDSQDSRHFITVYDMGQEKMAQDNCEKGG